MANLKKINFYIVYSVQYDAVKPHITPTDALLYDLYYYLLHKSYMFRRYYLTTNILVCDTVVAPRHKVARPPLCYCLL